MSMHDLQPPFPAAVNPHEPLVAQHLAIRAQQVSAADRELAAEFRKSRFERLISRMYPTAEPRALCGIADIVVWTFLLDDYLDPHRTGHTPGHVDHVQADIEAVLEQHDTTDHQGLLDSWLASPLRSLEGPDDAWRPRLVEHLRAFTAALCAEARAHASGITPSVAEYLLQRRDTSGWAAMVDLLELQPGTALPNSLRSANTTERMWTQAGEAASAINDILSLPKELARGERHNLVLLIQQHDACTLPEAVDRAHIYTAERTREYLKSKTEFLDHMAHSSPPMYPTGERFTAGLEHLMRGSYDWSIGTSRYAAREAEPTATQSGQ
jgi:Terpene synthase family 2, C-terminal metal binding